MEHLYKNDKKLEDLPEEDQVEIFRQQLAGNVSRYSGIEERFIGKPAGPTLYAGSVYRVIDRRKPDTLAWEYVDGEYKWCVRSDRGAVYLSHKKPEFDKDGRVRFAPGSLVRVLPKMFGRLHQNNGLPHTQSIIKRPE